MFAVLFPETSNANIPITISPTLMGSGQTSSSIGRTSTLKWMRFLFIYLSELVLFYHLSSDEPEISPKKGIGSGTQLYFGKILILALISVCFILHRKTLQRDLQ